MLSFVRPNAIPSFAPFYVAKRNFRPQEGEPYVQQDSEHWFVKLYLPDVEQEDFRAEIKESKLIVSWKDNKKIQHRGRIYTSSESYEKSLEVPEEVTQDDIKVHWEGNIAVVSISKPPQKLQLTEPKLPEDGTLMKMKVPEEGNHSLDVSVKDNHLSVVFETSGKREQGEGKDKFVSTFRNKIQRMIPIPEGVDASNIDTVVENGELVVKLKNLPTIDSADSNEEVQNS